MLISLSEFYPSRMVDGFDIKKDARTRAGLGAKSDKFKWGRFTEKCKAIFWDNDLSKTIFKT